MKAIKKLIATILLASLAAGGTGTLQAEEECYSCGDCYQECCTAPSFAPAVALTTVAFVAIVAVAVQNSNNFH